MSRILLALPVLTVALFASQPAFAQLSVRESPVTAPALGTVVRGSAATTFSISATGAVTQLGGNAVRMDKSSVTSPRVTIGCFSNNSNCRNRDVRVVVAPSGAWGDARISRLRIGALSGGSYRGSAPADGASLAFTLQPIGANRSVSFPLGMDVLLAAGAGSGDETFNYTVTATFQ